MVLGVAIIAEVLVKRKKLWSETAASAKPNGHLLFGSCKK
jgi:hypothetical protein